MAKSYCSTSIELSVKELIPKCELVYREAHKELDGIPLSQSKILKEVFIYYLKGTKYEVGK